MKSPRSRFNLRRMQQVSGRCGDASAIHASITSRASYCTRTRGGRRAWSSRRSPASSAVLPSSRAVPSGRHRSFAGCYPRSIRSRSRGAVRNEIKTLVRAEWLGGMQPLRGDSLLAAFYANELLVRLLARGDAHPQTFGSYVELLRSLTRNARHDAALRTFELDLLQDIGYAMPLDRCTEGSEIDVRAQYVFAGGQGARRIDSNVVRETDGGTCQRWHVDRDGRARFRTSASGCRKQDAVAAGDSLPPRRQAAEHTAHFAGP